MTDDNGSKARIVILDNKGCEDEELTAKFREFISNNDGSLGVELYPGAVHEVLKHVAKEFEEQTGFPFTSPPYIFQTSFYQISKDPFLFRTAQI